MKTYNDLEREWKEEILSTYEKIKLEYRLLQNGDIDKSYVTFNPLLMTEGYSASVYFEDDYDKFDAECRNAISGSKKYLCTKIEMRADVDGYCDGSDFEVEDTESFLYVNGYAPIKEIDFEGLFFRNDLRDYIRDHFKRMMDVSFVNLDCTVLKLFRGEFLDEKSIIELLKQKGC